MPVVDFYTSNVVHYPWAQDAYYAFSLLLLSLRWSLSEEVQGRDPS